MATGDGDGNGNEDDDPEFPDAWPIRSSQTSSVADRLPAFEFLPHELIRPRPSSEREQFFPEIPAPSLPRRSSETPFADRPPPFAFLPHELIPHCLSSPPKKSFPEIPTPSLPRRSSSQTPTTDRPIPLSLLPKELIPPPLLSRPKKSLPELPVTICNPNFRVPVPRNLPPGPWDPAEICPALSDLRISSEAENLPDYIIDWEGPQKLGNCSFRRLRDLGAPEPNPTYDRRSGWSSRRKRGSGRAANQRSGLDDYRIKQPNFHY